MSLELFNNPALQNRQFRVKLAEDPATAKDQIGQYILLTLKQEGVARRAWMPETIVTGALDVHPDKDIPVKYYGKELLTKAVSLNFRTGKAGVEYWEGQKFPLIFWKIESLHYRNNLAAIETSLVPMQEILKKNIIYSIQEEEDTRFLKLLEAAVAATGNVITSANTSITKDDLIVTLKQAPQHRGRITKLIMTEDRFYDVLGFNANDVGNDLVTKNFIDGYQYNTIFGIPVVTTNATTISNGPWDPKVIWAIPDKQYMGYFKIWIPNGTEMNTAVKIEGDETELWAYEYPAMGIGNINLIGKLQLS